jgi:hypothetical protein
MILEDDEIELFELAYHLRMPLYKLLDEMSYEELIGWSTYFKLRPIGWREDNRTALVMSSFGAKFKEENVFPSLRSLRKGQNTVGATLKGSAMFKHMLNAVGGDKLSFEDTSSGESFTAER